MKFLSNFRLSRRRPVESEAVRAMTTIRLAMRDDAELRRTTRDKIADIIFDATDVSESLSLKTADEIMDELFSVGPE